MLKLDSDDLYNLPPPQKKRRRRRLKPLSQTGFSHSEVDCESSAVKIYANKGTLWKEKGRTVGSNHQPSDQSPYAIPTDLFRLMRLT